MFTKLTIGIPKRTYQILKKESVNFGLSMAEVVRRWFEKYPIDNPPDLITADEGKLANSEIQEEQKSLRPIIFENNLLLRKIGRYLNTQIVLETDAQLPEHLKDREA